MIKFKQKGDFSRTFRYFEKVKNPPNVNILDKYGKEGVVALAAATPLDSGKTASMWRYEAKSVSGGASLSFYNDNVNKGVPIAIILQYGHGTRNGGYVQGRDYINPVMQPIFDRLLDEMCKEVTTV